MKAPDKIYIPLYPNHSLDGVHLGDDWMYEPHKECDNVTYIRKDALIEWLLKGVEMSEMCHSEYGDACAQAYQAVIDKLNSM